MIPKFSIFVQLPIGDKFEELTIKGEKNGGEIVRLVIPNIAKDVTFYYEDPLEKESRTLIIIGKEKISIPLPLKSFTKLLDQIERTILFQTITLN